MISNMSLAASVPEGAFETDVPLTISTRGTHVESVHRGIFAVADPRGRIVHAAGDYRQRTYLRSSAKPFQAMSLLITGAADAFGLSDEEIAIVCSSHSGQPEHVQAVTHLLTHVGVSPDSLQCGVHAPLDHAAAQRLVAEGVKPTQLHNNCSGKHAGMLATCKLMGWPLETYLDPSHPLQLLNLETLTAFTGLRADEIEFAVDGCGVPAHYIPIGKLATAFARLATGEGVGDTYQSAATRIRTVMQAYPFLIAGTGRFDTDLMIADSGTIVSKGGAQGVEGIGLLTSGLGFGLKIADGTSSSIGPVSVHVLDLLGAFNGEQRDWIADHTEVVIRNHAGAIVGVMRTTFGIGGAAE